MTTPTTEEDPTALATHGTQAIPEDGPLRVDTISSPIGHQPDPTRYGDWERFGRCIDF